MPQYVWKCDRCRQTREVERSIADRDVPPDGNADDICGEGDDHVWGRQLPTGVVLARGPNWTGGSKGNW